MEPKPTAEPALARIKPNLVPQTERSEDVVMSVFLYLFVA